METSSAGPPISLRLTRLLEMLILYWAFPLVVDFTEPWQQRALMPGLGIIGLILFVRLWRDPTFDRESLWNAKGFRRALPRMLLTWVIGVAIMVVTVIILDSYEGSPESVSLFSMVKRNPELVVAICLLYPIFSVYPQEIILRTFFFHRYQPILGGGLPLVVLSGLTFAWVHVIFQNWVAVLLCIPAGILFGWTYSRTKSTIASGFEHMMFGNSMWIIGLGAYFFAGAVGANLIPGASEGTLADPGGGPPPATTPQLSPDPNAPIPQTP